MPNVYAKWTAPPNICALTTKRTSGFSQGSFNSNNFGLHVDDNPAHVSANRSSLVDTLKLPSTPQWLEQTHSTLPVIIEEDTNRKADAAITRDPDVVLAIMTADCQPILLCNKQGTEIAAIHAGWRGLLNGVVENTIAKMNSSPSDILAWIGPAICPSCFEVGEEVREMYVKQYPFAINYFKSKGEKWLANLPLITEKILQNLSVSNVFQSHMCTYEQNNDFYSYRREQQTGRMASLIWFNNNRD
ncbi:MAG: peptidoglycan editing factor PgeF [Legionella sp.]|nr:peptidoglycan editing factor PgeF [Legionella sp.]